MPGTPFMFQDTIQANVGVPQGSNAELQSQSTGVGGMDGTSFIVWLVILGVVIPVLILGGLKVGGFQFVFKSR